MTVANVRGELVWIDPSLLIVPRGDGPSDFQRQVVSDRKVEEMSRNWLWPLCGALTVIKYPNGDLIVADGGHRRDAAVMRGIDRLPCYLVKFDTAAEAAAVFRLINNSRTRLVQSADFKAAIVEGDEIAIKMRDAFAKIGREPSKQSTPTTVSCLTTIRKSYVKDAATAERTISLMGEICAGHPFDVGIFKALHLIEWHLSHRRPAESLTREHRSRVIQAGYEGIYAGIHRAKLQAKAIGGGNDQPLIIMQGALNALNYEQKAKLTIKPSDKSLTARRATARKRARKVEIISAVGRRNRATLVEGGIQA